VTVLERMDALFGGVLLIAAGLAMAVLMGWVAPQRLQTDLAGCGSSGPLQRLLLVALRWVSPLAIAVGLAVSIGDLLQSWPGQG
jgi:NSS family neurotransmitter:Na+ symporter